MVKPNVLPSLQETQQLVPSSLPPLPIERLKMRMRKKKHRLKSNLSTARYGVLIGADRWCSGSNLYISAGAERWLSAGG